MAIYSLNLASIGRTTHAAGTAGAHLRYIGRASAEAEIVAKHMPADPVQARTWMDGAERSDRKNARVLDKVRIALPRELTPEQRMQLLRDFAQDLTGGRVPWYAAIHAAGNDAHNPHCHLVIRDRDIETGKRVLRLSDSARDRAKSGLEPKAVEWVREKWEAHANRALEQAGIEVRIDRRSLEAQGVDREPTIHIGPQAQHVDNFVQRPESKVVETGNGRSIDYPMIDAGRTRQERNAEIIDLNLEKAIRSPDFMTRETAKFTRDQVAKDRVFEAGLVTAARQRTLEHRRLRASIKSELDDIRSREKDEAAAMRVALRSNWAAKRSAMTEKHRSERTALNADQGSLSAKFMRIVDFTGRTRKRHRAEQAVLQKLQAEERQAMVSDHREQRKIHQEAVKSRYEDERRAVRDQFSPSLREVAVKHREAESAADRERQSRAADREQARHRFEHQLKLMQKMYRDRSKDRDRGRGPSIY